MAPLPCNRVMSSCDKFWNDLADNKKMSTSTLEDSAGMWLHSVNHSSKLYVSDDPESASGPVDSSGS